MAISISTTSPNALLDAFKKAIQDRKIETWIEKDGYFTHDTPQWRYTAWMKPSVVTGQLVFNIYPSTGGRITSVVYSIYHGRLIESFLAHFDKDFSTASATAMPTVSDKLS